MIYVDFNDSYIEAPKEYEALNRDIKLWLREYLDKSMLIFKIPDRMAKFSKEDKKAYKVGWLYQIMLSVYPEYTKTYIAERISEQFQMWISYRQFATLLHVYEKKCEQFNI